MTNLFNQRVAEITTSYSPRIKYADLAKACSSREAYELIADNWPDLGYCESFYIMLLNRNNKVLGIQQISKGGTAGTVADPKMIFQTALKANASFIILMHNHPSGNIKPSQADIDLTNKLKSAGAFLDMQVIDHMILTTETYFSFADEGIM